ncbi:DNA-deoxyinosine glycosylase [compost metagenome]
MPATYTEKKQLLEENDIALWDVLAYCERTGSLDSNIRNEKANDFKSFYKKYPSIKQVFFSSKNASNFYDKYVGRRKDIQYTILPSPSGANASKSFMQKLKEWEEIMEALN